MTATPTCGKVQACGRPADHRGHHGGHRDLTVEVLYQAMLEVDEDVAAAIGPEGATLLDEESATGRRDYATAILAHLERNATPKRPHLRLTRVGEGPLQ